MWKSVKSAVCAVAVIAGMGVASASAEDFSGKTLRIYVGTGPGTTYDSYARLLSEHMGAHIQGNPNIIVENMPGAGGTKVADFLAKVAPKDGTALGMLHQNLALGQILTPKKSSFNLTEFGWLGSVTSATSVLAVWHESPALTVEDAKTKELFMGTTGRGSETYQVPTAMNNILGTKFKVVSGYSALGEMDKAMEQGELHGRGGSLLSWTARRPDWVADQKVKFIVQVGLKKDKSIAEVPLLVDLAKNDADREVLELISAAGAIGRPLALPPEVADSVRAQLQKAFEATLQDAAFQKATEERGLPVDPSSASEIAELIKKTVNLPSDRAEAFRKVLGF